MRPKPEVPIRPIENTDEVPVIDQQGREAGRRTATYENLKPDPPDPGEVPDQQMVLVIVTVDGVTNRIDEMSLPTVRVNVSAGTFHRPNGDRILAFTPSRDAGKIFLASRKTGRKAKVMTETEGDFDPIVSHKAKGDKKLDLVRLDVAWSNCGNTSSNLIDAINDIQQLKNVARAVRCSTQAELLNLVDTLVGYIKSGKSHLVDFSFEGLHTFTVEIQPWGCYLPQGYQGAYTAFWWQGLTEEPLVLPGQFASETQQPTDITVFNAMTDLRRQYGLGQLLEAGRIITLIGGIKEMFSLGSYRPPATDETAVYLPWQDDVGDVPRFWNDTAVEFFRGLPFYPGQGSLDLTGISEAKAKALQKETQSTGPTHQVSEPTPMILIMNAYEIPAEQLGRVFEHFGGSVGTNSLCALLLNQVAERLRAGV